MGPLTEKFLEALGREVGFTPEATEGGLVPLLAGDRRALLHFREGEESLVLYAEIGRPAAARRAEALAHFMARNFLLCETGGAVFSYVPSDNMLGQNMRLDMNRLEVPVFLQSLDAFLEMAAENAALLARMNGSAAPDAPPPPPGGAQADGARGGGDFIRA